MSTSATAATFRPEWIIVGSRLDGEGKVWVMASAALEVAKMEPRLLQPRPVPHDFIWPVPKFDGFELTVGMRTYIWVKGGDYADAIRRLFEHWNPDDASTQPAVGPGTPAVGPAGEHDAS